MTSLFPSKFLPIGLILAVASGSASAANFNLNGDEYSLSGVYGFYANQSLLQSQPWWGSAGLTENFVNAAGAAGNPQSWFAYSNDGGMVVIGYYVNGWGAQTGLGWGTELASSNYFSVVTQIGGRTDISSGTILLSDVGSTVNPVFNGGSLTRQLSTKMSRQVMLHAIVPLPALVSGSAKPRLAISSSA